MLCIRPYDHRNALVAEAANSTVREWRSLGEPLKLEIMLRWVVTFFIIAIIAGILGFTGIAVGAASIARILFFVFLVLLVLSLLFGRRIWKNDL